MDWIGNAKVFPTIMETTEKSHTKGWSSTINLVIFQSFVMMKTSPPYLCNNDFSQQYSERRQ